MSDNIFNARVGIYIAEKNPCKDCQDRAIGCHGTCKDYIAQREVLDIAKADAVNQQKLNDYHADFLKNEYAAVG